MLEPSSLVSEWLNALLSWVTAHPGWMGLLVFLTALGESLAMIGLIMPGALLMFGFGALVALGQLDFWAAWGWAAAGAVAGDGLSFWLGRALHERLRQLWPFSRHPELLARSVDFFARHGGKSVLLGRFIGPVRPVLPAVAGMLDMPVGRFLLIDIGSALLWAPAYLVPGMVFATSLELAARVAWRLLVLILLVVGLLGLTVWGVRALFRLLQPRVQRWLRTFSDWSRGRPLIGPISASLLDPQEGELRGLLSVAVLLLGVSILVNLLWQAAGQRLPTTLDQNLYRFLQDLRTPWADQVMIAVTELGDSLVKGSLAVAVFGWLLWQRAYPAAWHWLAALGFGALTNTLFTRFFQVTRPAELYQGVAYAFPSNHTTLTTILFGFLAVLIARETTPARRWLPYLAAALIIIPMAFSRLYLGAHWLTDTLGGISLGVVWVTLLGLAYRRHPAPRIGRRALVLVSGTTLLVAQTLNVALHHREDQSRYRSRPLVEREARDEWWQRGWQRLPAYRLDFRGRHRQPLVLQWASARRELERRLQAAGWQPAPPLTLSGALAWLNPQPHLTDLPVLPQAHEGRHEALAWVLPGELPETRWVLHCWDSGVRLQTGDTPVWLGSLTLQRLERRLDFLALAVEVEQAAPPPWEWLAPLWQGLPVKLVSAPEQGHTIALIDGSSAQYP